MTMLFALIVAVLFGCGAYLMLTRDLYRIVAGTVLMSNGANLYLIAAALSNGVAPIHPLAESTMISDPLVQALVLTALVITFAMCALLLSLVLRIYASHETIDLREIAQTEQRDIEQRRQEDL